MVQRRVYKILEVIQERILHIVNLPVGQQRATIGGAVKFPTMQMLLLSFSNRKVTRRSQHSKECKDPQFPRNDTPLDPVAWCLH